MSKIIQVWEHNITIPEPPKESKTISGSFGHKHVLSLDDLIIGRNEKNHKWERQQLPDYFYEYIPGKTKLYAEKRDYDDNDGTLISLNEEETEELIFYHDREWYRRMYGVHFRNGDDWEYLTNDHYFFLQWAKLYGAFDNDGAASDYGLYMEFQRDTMYMIKKTCNDPNSLGLYIAKPKKTGITQLLAAGYYLNKATSQRQKMMGIMSKGGDASDVNMMFFLNALDGLPPIFQPSVKSRADKAGEIYFGESPVKFSHTKKGQERKAVLASAKPLNSRVWAAATKEAGFDSPLMSDMWFDELPKYDTENKQEPETVFSRNKEAVKIQDIINGKIWITSYPPERDTKGFFQSRQIWKDSKLNTIKDGKRTKSGLHTLYISSLNSYRSALDEYGRVNQKKAHELNQQERLRSSGNKKELQAKMRQYHETEKECWSSSGAGSVFDNIRFGSVVAELERDSDFEDLYVDGKLEWENTIWEISGQRPAKAFGRVKFVPLNEAEKMAGEEGRLRIYFMPKNLNKPLAYGQDEEGNLNAPDKVDNYGGVDPTDYAASSEVIEGSKNASVTMNFLDYGLNAQYRKIVSNIIISDYLYRPENPDEFYEDVVKEIIFFGKRVIVEANKAWLATKLIEDGLGRYMMVKNKDGVIVPFDYTMIRKEGNKTFRDYSLIRTGTEELEAIVRAIKSYSQKSKDDEALDFLEANKSLRVLSQILDFSIEYSKMFDLVMAWGWALICGEVEKSTVYYEDSKYSTELVSGIMSYFGLND